MSRNWLISRHPGALAWAKTTSIHFDRVLPHLSDVNEVAPDDNIYGTLPVQLAALICARGGRYFHLSLQLPPSLRGKELTAEQMNQYQAEFVEFVVSPALAQP